MKLDSWRARVLIVLGLGLYRLWARTLRLQVEDPNDVVAFVRNQPVIFAIWHNRLLMLPRSATEDNSHPQIRRPH